MIPLSQGAASTEWSPSTVRLSNPSLLTETDDVEPSLHLCPGRRLVSVLVSPHSVEASASLRSSYHTAPESPDPPALPKRRANTCKPGACYDEEEETSPRSRGGKGSRRTSLEEKRGKKRVSDLGPGDEDVESSGKRGDRGQMVNEEEETEGHWEETTGDKEGVSVEVSPAAFEVDLMSLKSEGWCKKEFER